MLIRVRFVLGTRGMQYLAFSKYLYDGASAFFDLDGNPAPDLMKWKLRLSQVSHRQDGGNYLLFAFQI